MKLILTLLLFSIILKLHGQVQYDHKRIIVFKDGTAFIEKSTSVPLKNKMVYLYPTPYSNLFNDKEIFTYSNRNNLISQNKRIVFGSLRFDSPNNTINEIAYLETIFPGNAELNRYISSGALFQNNIGKKVSLVINNSDEPIKGEIISTLSDMPNRTTSVVILSEKTHQFVNFEQIQSVTFLPYEQNFTIFDSEKAKESVIRLSFQRDTKNQDITISYLQKGMTWMPNYFIDIRENNKARISLFANLLNDIESIKNADFYFAVGIPSFIYSYVNSPMTAKTDVLQVLAELSNPPKEINAGIHHTMSQRGNPIEANYGTNFTSQFEGRNQDELYFYEKKNISIDLNNRILLPIFEGEFSYSEIYEVDLRTNLESDRLIKSDIGEQVWQCISFKNTIGYPFTTGVVFFVKTIDDEIKGLSQNEIQYTPNNEHTTVKVTMTPDIRITQTDHELNRERKGSYSLVTIESIINIVNLKPVDIKMNVNRNVFGELMNSDTKWEYSTLISQGRNKLNVIKWNLGLKAGKATEIKYTYNVLVWN